MQPKQKLHYIYIKNMFESLLNKLINFDKFLMVMLNYDGGDIQDMIWWCISSRLIWVPIALTLIVYMLRDTKKWKQAVVMILAIALIVTICDQVSSTLMKPYFARLRPSHTPGLENLLHYVYGYHGGKYGFPSSHAANAFGSVTFVALLLRNRIATILLFAFAFMVSYSRIYLGVHFPIDIFVGSMLGILTGTLVYKALPRRCHQHLVLDKTAIKAIYPYPLPAFILRFTK